MGGGIIIDVQVVSSFDEKRDRFVKMHALQNPKHRSVGASLIFNKERNVMVQGPSIALSFAGEVNKTIPLVRSALKKKQGKGYDKSSWVVVSLQDNEAATLLNFPSPKCPMNDLQLQMAKDVYSKSLKDCLTDDFVRVLVTSKHDVLFNEICTHCLIEFPRGNTNDNTI